MSSNAGWSLLCCVLAAHCNGESHSVACFYPDQWYRPPHAPWQLRGGPVSPAHMHTLTFNTMALISSQDELDSVCLSDSTCLYRETQILLPVLGHHNCKLYSLHLSFTCPSSWEGCSLCGSGVRSGSICVSDTNIRVKETLSNSSWRW